MGEIVNAVSDVLGFGPASKQASAVKSAAQTSADANKYAADLQKQMLERQIALQEPWRQAGIGALNQLTAGLAEGGRYATPFSQTNFQTDPGYSFRLSEGLKALDRQAAARGSLISGAALKAAQGYGQNLASEEYQNAFNRYYNERNNMLAPLQSLAGIGQTSANTLGSAAQNYGTNAANLAMYGGANQANAALQLGNIRASQYGNIGAGINQALNTDWNKVGNTLGSWFRSSPSPSSPYVNAPDYSGNPYGP